MSGKRSTASFEQQFTDGDITLNCNSLWCALGSNRRLYEERRWYELARAVSDKNYNMDIQYFYLGAAAENLGFPKAAISYYQMAQTNPHKCTSTCYGVNVTSEAYARIRYLTDQANSTKHIDLSKKRNNTPTQSTNTSSSSTVKPYQIISANSPVSSNALPIPASRTNQNFTDRSNAATIKELLQGEDTCPKNSNEPILCKPLSRTLSDLTPAELNRYRELVKQQSQTNAPKERVDMGPPLICGKSVDCSSYYTVSAKMKEKLDYLKRKSQSNAQYEPMVEACEFEYKQVLYQSIKKYPLTMENGRMTNLFLQKQLDACSLPLGMACLDDLSCMLPRQH